MHLLGKELEIPDQILKREALLRRLRKSHPLRPLIEEDLAIRKAGFKGEQSLSYYFSFLEDGKYVIFRGIRLRLGHYYFQIDVLLISKFFMLIIENKHNKGKLVYNPATKTYTIINRENEEESFPDPIAQAQRQKLKLEKWFSEMQLPAMPIEYLVNFSNPSIILSSTGPTDIFRKLGKSEHLIPKIFELEKKYTQEKITLKDLKKINKMILKHDCPLPFLILQYYSIALEEIIPGVLCPICLYTPMTRKHSIWECPKCHYESKDAHIQAIMDYLLLVEPVITNEKCRNFLGLKRHTSRRILLSMGLLQRGTFKDKEYFFIEE